MSHANEVIKVEGLFGLHDINVDLEEFEKHGHLKQLD